MKFVTRLGRAALAVLALALMAPAAALAQSAVVYQSGLATPGDLAKFLTQGRIGDVGGAAGAGGVLGDPQTGLGVNPYAITDLNGPGLGFYTAGTGGAYHSLTIGHDANGNALIDVESNGLANTNFNLRLNGTIYSFPFILGGISGPATTVIGDLPVWGVTTGNLLGDSGVPIASLAPLASPSFTGAPLAPTAAPGTSSTQLATTGFVAKAAAPQIDLILIAGQSNAVGYGGTVPGIGCGTLGCWDGVYPPAPSPGVYQYDAGTNTISAGAEPSHWTQSLFQYTSGSGGAWGAFANRYVAATGHNVLLVPSASGGTYQAQAAVASNSIQPTLNWEAGGLLFNASIANLNAAIAKATAQGFAPVVKYLFWMQGEADANAIGSPAPIPNDVNGSVAVTSGPYSPGATSLTVSGLSSSTIAANQAIQIELSNGSFWPAGAVTGVAGSTVSFTNPIPAGLTVQTGAPVLRYTATEYQTAFQTMLAAYRAATIGGTIYPTLPVLVSLTGVYHGSGGISGETSYFDEVDQAQDQVAQGDLNTKIASRAAPTFIFRGLMQPGTGGSSTAHYLQEGYNEIGLDFASCVLSLPACDGPAHTTSVGTHIALGGTLRTGDVFTLSYTGAGLWSGTITSGATVVGGDTFATLLARLAASVAQVPAAASAGLAASVQNQTLTVTHPTNLQYFPYPYGSAPATSPVTVSISTTGGTPTTILQYVGRAVGGYEAQMFTLPGQRSGDGTSYPGLQREVMGPAGLPATSGVVETGSLRISNSTYGNSIDFGCIGVSPYYCWEQVTDRTNLGEFYPLMLNPNGGNVGIGHMGAAPVNQLDVGGGVAIGNTFAGSQTAPAEGLAVQGEILAAGGVGFAMSGALAGPSIWENSGAILVLSAGTGGFQVNNAANNLDLFSLTAAGVPQFAQVTTGTPTNYACFDVSNDLIKSATAC